LGEGLSANAQREIIEVLLAHPSMFDDVKDKISPANFDIPALQQIAQAIFQTLGEQPRAALSVMCSAVEDPRIAGLMTTLEHDGSQKGNYTKRLTDALAALEHTEQQRDKTASTKGNSVLDASKENRRNMGMI
jgi:replicative DNA helicase